MKLLERFSEQADEFLKVCRRMSDGGFVAGHGGNLAWKLEDRIIMITATHLPKGEHTREDLVFIDPDGNVLEGHRPPTGERALYFTLFRERPDVKSIIHCHPPHCCALAISEADNPLELPLFPEISLEIGPVPRLPYITPLTQELADGFLPYIQKYNAFLMGNHGVVILGPDPITRTMDLMTELESGAHAALLAMSIGKLKPISRERLLEIDRLIEENSLPLPGAPGANRSLTELYGL